MQQVACNVILATRFICWPVFDIEKGKGEKEVRGSLPIPGQERQCHLIWETQRIPYVAAWGNTTLE